MKQLIICITLAAGIAAATGCNDKPAKPAITGHPSPNSGDTIICGPTSGGQDSVSKVLCPLTTAFRDVQLFDSLSRAYLGDSIPVRAYTIRAVDLLDALGMPDELADSAICKYKYIRAYLGYRKGKGFKLYIVPVVGASLKDNIGGCDIMLNSIGKAAVRTGGLTGYAEEEEYVLDLNAPCPKTCPDNSPFMHQ